MIQEDRFRGGSAELFPGCSLLIRNVYTNRARRIYIKCIDDRIGLTFASCISLSTVHRPGWKPCRKLAREVKRKWNVIYGEEKKRRFRNGAFFIAVFKHAIPTTCPLYIT